MIDLKLSSDGDLELGQQATDNDGYLLYYYVANENGDLLTTTNPDIGTVPVRDMKMIYGVEGDIQLIQTRLKTENPDWILYPNVGGDLTDLLGRMNTIETAQDGIDMIYRALTYDGAFKQEELKVDAVPVSQDAILFNIKLTRNNTIVTYATVLDLELNTWNEYQLYNTNQN